MAEEIVYLLYKIGPLGWGDAPFHRGIADPADQGDRDAPAAGERALLHLHLVSAEDGVLRAMRAVSIGHDFTARLHEAIRRQQRELIREEYFRRIARHTARYPNPDEIVFAAEIRSLGGRLIHNREEGPLHMKRETRLRREARKRSYERSLDEGTPAEMEARFNTDCVAARDRPGGLGATQPACYALWIAAYGAQCEQEEER